jgi:plasmid stability protein
MTRVTLQIPDELHKRLSDRARETGETVSQAIVDILSDAMGPERTDAQAETPLDAERRRIREALGDLVVDFHPEDFGALFHPLPDDFDREAFFQSLPRLDPPLSRTIIEDREDRI